LCTPDDDRAQWHQFDRPFGLPSGARVISLRRILDGTMPTLYVVHDGNGDWQFLHGGPVRVEDGAVVHLGHLILHDRSILEVANLPCGWEAWRTDSTAPWQRQPRPDPGDAHDST
jgi:hypothetical protein